MTVPEVGFEAGVLGPARKERRTMAVLYAPCGEVNMMRIAVAGAGGVEVSHPSDKNRDVARVGHPDSEEQWQCSVRLAVSQHDENCGGGCGGSGGFPP